MQRAASGSTLTQILRKGWRRSYDQIFYCKYWKIKQVVALTPVQMPPPDEKAPKCVNKTG